MKFSLQFSGRILSCLNLCFRPFAPLCWRSHELVHVIVPACTPCGHDPKVSLLAFILATTKGDTYRKVNKTSNSIVSRRLVTLDSYWVSRVKLSEGSSPCSQKPLLAHPLQFSPIRSYAITVKPAVYIICPSMSRHSTLYLPCRLSRLNYICRFNSGAEVKQGWKYRIIMDRFLVGAWSKRSSPSLGAAALREPWPPVLFASTGLYPELFFSIFQSPLS
jgi:hypothetical protein